MIGILQTCRSTYAEFRSGTIEYTLVFLALIFWMGRKQNDKKSDDRRCLCTIVIFWTILSFLPIFRLFFETIGGNADDVLYAYACIPEIVLIAAGCTDLIRDYQKKSCECKKRKKFLYALSGVLLLFMLWNFQFTEKNTRLLPAGYELDGEVAQIKEVCLENACTLIIAPDEVAAKMRECDLAVSVVYGENYTYSALPIQNVITDAENFGSQCVVIPKEYMDLNYMEEHGYHVILETSHYYVEKREESSV